GKEIVAAVAADPNAIGYTGMGQVEGVSSLSISDGPGTPALAATPFTVATEDYPLTRRLYFYLPASPTPMAKKFAAFAAGPKGQTVVKEQKFVEQTARFERVPHTDLATPQYRRATDGRVRMSINFRFKTGGKELDNKALADIDRAVAGLNE